MKVIFSEYGMAIVYAVFGLGFITLFTTYFLPALEAMGVL